MVERGANTDEYSSKDTDGMGAVYSCVEKSLRFHWGPEMAMWYSANWFMMIDICSWILLVIRGYTRRTKKNIPLAET